MDPLSNDIISSEFGVESEPQPAENVTYMDVALYMAAARGKFEEFDNYQAFELESLRTSNRNTVLHVYLATHELFRSRLRFLLGCTCIRLIVLSLLSNKFKTRSNFIEQILNMCPSLLLQDNARGQTPLHIAARYGHSAIVKFLINRAKAPHGDLENPGMDELEAVRSMLRKTDLESNTALHVAAEYGHVRVVQELLEFEDPDFPYYVNKNQETPLYIAARRGDGPLLTMILDELRSTAHGGPHGRTVLHAVAMAGDAEATRIILNRTGNLTQQTDENGQTPLHYAAHLGHYSVVKELLKRGKSAAYIADKKSEMTPLLMAARQGYEQIVREIISYCPDCCEMVNNIGWNLLHFVAVRRSPFRFLKVYGETLYGSVRNLIDAKDARGLTPIQVYDATLSRQKNEAASFKNNQCKKKREEIVNLLDNIMNEEVAEKIVRPIRMRNARYNSTDSIEKAREAHLVVAALIATVTFAAAITVPGGYKTENGSDQGTPFLIDDAAFITFVISDALAFIFSIIAIAIHFEMSLPFFSNQHDQRDSFELAAAYIIYALWAIMFAFSTGIYVILQPSPGLAVTLLSIGLFFTFALLLMQSSVLLDNLLSEVKSKMDHLF